MYCPNDGCPDFAAAGVRGEYGDDVLMCPRCQTPLRTTPPEPAQDGGWLESEEVRLDSPVRRRSRVVRLLCSLVSSEDGPSPLRLAGRTSAAALISSSATFFAICLAGFLVALATRAPKTSFFGALALPAAALVAPAYLLLFSVAAFPSAVLVFRLLRLEPTSDLAALWGVFYGVSFVLVAMLIAGNGYLRDLVMDTTWWVPFAVALGVFILDLPLAWLAARVGGRNAAA